MPVLRKPSRALLKLRVRKFLLFLPSCDGSLPDMIFSMIGFCLFTLDITGGSVNSRQRRQSAVYKEFLNFSGARRRLAAFAALRQTEIMRIRFLLQRVLLARDIERAHQRIVMRRLHVFPLFGQTVPQL